MALLALAALAAGPPARGEPAAPDLVERLLFVGTSLTAVGTWPDAVARAVAACRDGPVVVKRIAKPGANSDWGAAQAEQIQSARADVVVVEFIANDAALHRGVWRARSAENHRAIIEAARSGGARAVLLVVTGPVRGVHRILRYFLDDYAALYLELDDGDAVRAVDTRAFWPVDPDTLASLIPDGLHPTDAAMERHVGEAVSARLCFPSYGELGSRHAR